MNKIDLIQELKDSSDLSKPDAEKIVTLFFDKMPDALAQGDRVEIRGLCSFFVKKTVSIPDEIREPVRRLRSNRRSCRFSKRARS
jgi:integration host factor subunit beta